MGLSRLAIQEALNLLRHCLDGGAVIPSKHFQDELANEGLVFSDALQVLRSGNIYDAPEQDLRTGDWKYRVEGYEPDGLWLAIVLTFRAQDVTFLITVFSVQSRSRGR